MPGNSLSSAMKPCFEMKRSGRLVTPFVPTFMPRTGAARSRRNAVERAKLRPGRRSTRLMIAPQNRPSGFSASYDFLPTNGMRSAFTRSPRRPRSAGSSVVAAATETIPTRIAPTARLRMIELGTRSIPNMATTNAVPLKTTARFAVPPDAVIASVFSSPFARSSR